MSDSNNETKTESGKKTGKRAGEPSAKQPGKAVRKAPPRKRAPRKRKAEGAAPAQLAPVKHPPAPERSAQDRSSEDRSAQGLPTQGHATQEHAAPEQATQDRLSEKQRDPAAAAAPQATAAERVAPAPAREAAPAARADAAGATAAPAQPAPQLVESVAVAPAALIRVPLSVRWRDLDAFNHVNNSKFLSYLEEARLRWMVTLPGHGMDEHVAPVVAAAHLNYRRPIEWPNEIDIELFVERLGNTSLSVGHRIVGADDPSALYCDGNVVMVWIHRETGQPAALPEAVRAACAPR